MRRFRDGLIDDHGEDAGDRRGRERLSEIFEEAERNSDVADDEREIDRRHGEVSGERADRRAVDADLRIRDENHIQKELPRDAAEHGDDRLLL